ncbi:MAG: ABC transporter permease [Acidimicrobiales bacterium mtb01]|nr:ABC transporter permease [Actinomycetota bacterium]TEX47827.1 MAG: ABC transporter permease [Acidimicrobiales bacterium mtb01]
MRADRTVSKSVATDGLDLPWARRLAGHSDPSRRFRGVGPIVAIALVGGIWSLVAYLQIWSEIILPTPDRVWSALVESVTSEGGRRGLSGHYLWEHVGASLWRIIRGVFWAAAFGAPLGLGLGLFRTFQAVAEPIVGFLRSLPPLGYFSLLIIWFGIDDTSKVWLLFIAAFPPIAIGVAAGVASIQPERVKAALTLGATRRDLVRHTILPSTLPDLLTGLRVAIGFAWTTIVAAETSNGIPGIGGLAWATKKELRSDVAILCVIVIGVVAVLMDLVIRLIERRLLPWRRRS